MRGNAGAGHQWRGPRDLPANEADHLPNPIRTMSEQVLNISRRAKRWALHYLYAMAASSWNAGIATAVATLGLAAGAAVEPDKITPLDLDQIWGAFIYGAAINAIYHLRKNPIPESLPTETTAPFAK
jgi:hypothetical protein